MAALRVRSDEPMRQILARRMGPRLRPSADPFAELAGLVAWEAKGHRHGLLASVLDGLFNQRGGATGDLVRNATASLA